MKRALTFASILIFSSSSINAEEKEDPTFTVKQGGETYEVKASESPQLKQLYDQIKEKSAGIKEQYGVVDPPSEDTSNVTAAPVAESESKPKLQGSKSVAEEAYKNNDYETAYEHYQALSAQGDTEASMKLAAMHSRGEGVAKDEDMAFAYFARAAEQGDKTAQELIGTTHFDDAQRNSIKEKYKTISEEIDDPEIAKKAGENFNNTQSQSSQYRGISTPESIGFDYRSDPDKLKAKTYVQRSAQSYERAPAKSYSQRLTRSYEPKHVRIQRQVSVDSESDN